MRGLTICIVVCAAILLFCSGSASAGGLSTHFVQVTLKDLELGKTYSMKDEVNKPLVIKNTTKEATINIRIEPEIPVAHNLVPGYEPIPDLSWIKIKKSYFEEVGPGDAIETDIELEIPDDDQHKGKKYQVYIYSHTAGKTGIRMGLMSRILFTTSAKRSEPE